MAASDRKKNIMNHLAITSSNLNFSRKPRQTNQAPPPPVTLDIPVTPTSTPPSPSSRKRAIMDHLARSSNDYDQLSFDSSQRKQQIKNHLRLSQGK